MRTPAVSVIMPVYNGEKYISQAVDCLLRQSFADFELIIIDDHSTDSSASIIESYGDPRIIFLKNSENMGSASVRNRGMEIARGRYIAFEDCDDISLPERLERQVFLLDHNPEVGLCGTWARTMGGQPECVLRYPSDPPFVRARILFDNPVATSSVMMRSACLDRHSVRFNPSFMFAEDYELWERISSVWGITNIPTILTLYRVHPAQQTATIRIEKKKAFVWNIQYRLLARLGIVPTQEEKRLHLDIGASWRFLPDFERAMSSERWLRKLGEANLRRKVFPEEAFWRVLAERWLLAASAAAGCGLKTWSLYRRSKLSRWTDRGLWRSARLFSKCLRHEE